MILIYLISGFVVTAALLVVEFLIDWKDFKSNGFKIKDIIEFDKKLIIKVILSIVLWPLSIMFLLVYFLEDLKSKYLD